MKRPFRCPLAGNAGLGLTYSQSPAQGSLGGLGAGKAFAGVLYWAWGGGYSIAHPISTVTAGSPWAHHIDSLSRSWSAMCIMRAVAHGPTDTLKPKEMLRFLFHASRLVRQLIFPPCEIICQEHRCFSFRCTSYLCQKSHLKKSTQAENSNLAPIILIKIMLNELFPVSDNTLHVCESMFTFLQEIKLALHYSTLKGSFLQFYLKREYDFTPVF